MNLAIGAVNQLIKIANNVPGNTSITRFDGIEMEMI